MKKILRNLIQSTILKKYPEIVSVDEITDLSEELGLESYENNYHVSFTTSECLNDKKMMEIDSEVKMLFSMLSLKNTNPFSIRLPSIKCFFDCGDGEGYTFSARYGYNH